MASTSVRRAVNLILDTWLVRACEAVKLFVEAESVASNAGTGRPKVSSLLEDQFSERQKRYRHRM